MTHAQRALLGRMQERQIIKVGKKPTNALTNASSSWASRMGSALRHLLLRERLAIARLHLGQLCAVRGRQEGGLKGTSGSLVRQNADALAGYDDNDVLVLLKIAAIW
jgi:hypothetical protein